MFITVATCKHFVAYCNKVIFKGNHPVREGTNAGKIDIGISIPRTISIVADKQRFQRAILNLIKNTVGVNYDFSGNVPELEKHHRMRRGAHKWGRHQNVT
jgi:hypothetical protein